MVTECIYGRKKRVGRESDTPGGFTRVIQSRLPVSKRKKREKKKRGSGGRKKKHQPARQKQEGGKGRTYLPLNEPPSFLSPSCLFSSLSLFTLHFTYTLNLCQWLLCPPLTPSYDTPPSFFFKFSPSHHTLPICLTQTCFPGPAIHRYGIHQQ